MVNVPAGGGAAPKPKPVSFEQAIFDDLRDVFHLTAAQDTGFLGNFQVESGFDPRAFNAGEGAIGAAQWENGRRTALQRLAASLGLKETDPRAQIAYLNQELAGPFAGVIAQIRGVNDPISAAHIVQAQYEISDPASLGKRESAAASIFAQITGGQPLTGGAGLSNGQTAPGLTAGFTGGAGAKPPPAPFPSGKYTKLSQLPKGAWAKILQYLHDVGFNLTGLSKSEILVDYNFAANPKNLSGVQEAGGLQGILNDVTHGLLGVGETVGGGVLDVGNAIGGLPGEIIDWLDTIFSSFAKWVENAFIVIIGAIMILLALYLLAHDAGKSDDDDAGGGVVEQLHPQDHDLPAAAAAE